MLKKILLLSVTVLIGAISLFSQTTVTLKQDAASNPKYNVEDVVIGYLMKGQTPASGQEDWTWFQQCPS